MGLIVNFSDFENISASNLSFNDYLIGYATNPNREVRTTIEDLINFMESASANDLYQILAANSASWDSTYTSLNANSGKYESSYTSLNANSGKYESSYTTLNANSANYILDGGNTKGANISIGTNDAYNLSFETNAISRLLITSDTLSGNSSKTSFGAGSATGLYSFATGYNTKAFGNYSYAEGINNTASGYASHAQGAGNLASNNYSHTQGENNIASGESSYAGGGGTLASGTRSTATGQFTSATKTNSYASGKLAFANHNRSWVWQGTNQDGVAAQFASTRTDQFAIRPTNGFFLSGAMGINTDSIDNALTVSGNISARDTVIADALSARYLGLVHIPAGDGIDPSIRMGETGATGFSGVFISYNESTNVFGISSLFSPAAAVGPAIAIDRNSNVGIGTDAPDEKLHVLKASAGTVTADTNSIAVFEGGGNAHISILTPNGQTGGVVFGSPSDNYGSYLSWNYDNNELKLGTDKTGGFISLLTNDEAEAARITSTGNVGIGTDAPNNKLTVAGNISASGTIYATNIITNVSILSTDSTVITIDNSNFNTYLSKILHVRSASNTRINFETSLPEGFNVMILNETTYNVTLTSTANNIYLSFGSVLSGQQGAKQLYSSASVYKYGNNVYAIGALV